MWSKVHKSLDSKQEMLRQKYLKKQSPAPLNEYLKFLSLEAP